MKRKVVLLALALVVSASFNVAGAAEKKKKEQKANTAAAPTGLKTQSDSLSYAAGMSRTEGLLPFLKQQYGVEEAEMPTVIEAFEQTMKQGANAKTKAYAAGQQVAFMVLDRMLPYMKEQLKGSKDSINTEIFTQGFVNALKNDHKTMDMMVASGYFERAMKRAVDERNAAFRKAGEDFLAENAKKEGVVTLPSGLQYKVLVKGTGEVPTDSSEVKVKYEGRLIDGTVFDSSYKRKDESSTFRANQVIKGWTEALTMMPVGSKWELYIPQNLAYGERNMGEIKPYSTLIFTVELVSIVKPEAKAESAKPVTSEGKASATTAKPASTLKKEPTQTVKKTVKLNKK